MEVANSGVGGWCVITIGVSICGFVTTIVTRVSIYEAGWGIDRSSHVPLEHIPVGEASSCKIICAHTRTLLAEVFTLKNITPLTK